MKKFALLLLTSFVSTALLAQAPSVLPIIRINKDVSTHFVAPDKIKYVDISVGDIVGDIPVNNVVRVKPIKEGANGVITITTERYFVQYMLVYSSSLETANTSFNIPITDLKSYMNPEVNMTKSEMYNYAYSIFNNNKRYFDVSTTENKVRVMLNNVYTFDNYYFLDISVENQSKIQYDIDQVRFKIEDKKKTKATNFQSVEIQPLLELQTDKVFKKHYRNVFVFEKFTFPEEKSLCIEISEKQISGRTITLRLDYVDVLNADTFVKH